jgi:hypothetical protein
VHTSYHKQNTASTPDASLIARPLRRTLTLIHDLTRKRGYCYAGFRFLADRLSLSFSTIRRHVSRLIALGIVRREDQAGFADRLFICPESAWKMEADCVTNGQTLHQSPHCIEQNNKQQTRKRVTRAEPSPVVVLSATPTDQDADDLSAFRALMAQEEPDADANAALGDVERQETPTVTAAASPAVDPAPQPRPVPIPDAVPACPVVSAPARMEAKPTETAPISKASPKPPDPSPSPEHRRTVEQLVEAGVNRTTAAQTVAQDPARAACALAALLSYQRRHSVACATALYRVAFRDRWTSTQRQQEPPARPMTPSALGLIAAPASGRGATVTVSDAAALRAMIATTRRAVNPLRC